LWRTKRNKSLEHSRQNICHFGIGERHSHTDTWSTTEGAIIKLNYWVSSLKTGNLQVRPCLMSAAIFDESFRSEFGCIRAPELRPSVHAVCGIVKLSIFTRSADVDFMIKRVTHPSILLLAHRSCHPPAE
jgi:hypothetical protein